MTPLIITLIFILYVLFLGSAILLSALLFYIFQFMDV